MSSNFDTRIRHVTAVLGPTNTGKTHLAIERMLGHETGIIGLPLRLLAREVYDKVARRVGRDKVALITGEEKIKPDNARYWVSTVEAMPRDLDVDFLAIDEVQLASDPERGHVFTDRLLHARGQSETLLLGAQTMRTVISELIPGANFISRPRLSKLTYAGEKKITRLPERTAVVAFSANEVYSIAELIRRQSGGAAVVLGALSPRTRNAQVELYQSGDVNYLVATDAVGMGLNLDVDHVAFSAVRKFDGVHHRNLTPSEIAQIAGRAGRHMNDGTFGVTGSADGFDSELVQQLEDHTFEDVRVLQWRNAKLDFRSLGHLHESLREMPRQARLVRARTAGDVEALEMACRDPVVKALASAPAAVARLWEACQIPDYRKITSQNHADMVATVYKFLLSSEERIPDDWFAKQVDFANKTDGDIDTLANRIAHIRTWTFVSNRSDWLRDPEYWQGRTREVEDALSDALHERLTQRFVDRRTSALMKGMRDKDELSADIAEDGSIEVEDHYVGRIIGFRYTPDAAGEGIHGKAARSAAVQVLAREIAMRARRVAAAKPEAFKLTRDARVLWHDEEIARLGRGEDPLRPLVNLTVDEHISAPDREKVQTRLDVWIAALIADRLKPLVELTAAEEVSGLARGIAFQLKEKFGILKRDDVAGEIKSLDQTARAQLRKYGVRFGAFNIFFPLLLKPAPAELSATLWALQAAGGEHVALDTLPELPRPGLTSMAAAPDAPEGYLRAYGFHLCGPRAVRVDILERLADLIRPLLAFRRHKANGAEPPVGATGDGGFKATPDMMSILGCSPAELGDVLTALNFKLERRPIKVVTPALSDPSVYDDAGGDATTAAASAATGAATADVDAKAAVDDAASKTSETSAPPASIIPGDAAAESAGVTEAQPAMPPPEDVAVGSQSSDLAAAATVLPVSTNGAVGDPAGDPANADVEAVTAESEMEEIWRPRSFGQRAGAGNRRHAPRRPGGSDGADARPGAVGDAEASEKRAGAHRRRRAAAISDAASKDEATPRHGRDRTASGQQSKGSDGRGGHDGKGQGGRDFAAKGRSGKGPPRGRDDQRSGARTHTSSPPKPRREKQADPDSPFAALEALKSKFAKGSPEKSSS